MRPANPAHHMNPARPMNPADPMKPARHRAAPRFGRGDGLS